TTTLVYDNLIIFNLHYKMKVLLFIVVFEKLPISMFWWERYDSQTALRDEVVVYNTKNIFDWLENPSVVQGGELTAWPELLDGDDSLLYWLHITNNFKKLVEGLI